MAYEIANRMNFPSASAFSKFFKRETGLTPRAYQETTYNKKDVLSPLFQS